MKFWKIFQFEFNHQLRSLQTWIYLIVLFLFPIMMNVLTTPGDGVYPNNTFHIISVTIIGIFIWLVMGAAVAGEAASRDVQKRMHPLTYTTPINKFDYMGGRLLAAFAINALLILMLPLATWISFAVGLDTGDLLPFRPSVYLNVYFAIALPSVFLATCLQFAFASLSREPMTSYIASVLLALFPQLVAAALAKLSGNWDILKLLDPIGVAGIIGSELSTWTPTEKNTRVVLVEGMFLLNRFLCIAVGVFSLILTFQRFRFDHSTKPGWFSRFKRKPKAKFEMQDVPVSRKMAGIAVPSVIPIFSVSTFFRQALWIAKVSYLRMVKHPVGVSLVILIALVSAMFGANILSQFGIPLLPTTQQVLEYLTAPISNASSPWVVIPLLIMYFSGQLVWHDRNARMNDIVDATPINEWTLFIGKFMGLALIIITWLVIMFGVGILMQLLLGYENFEISLYLKALFGLQLIDYLLFALLALVVHVVVNHKNLGFLVLFLVFIFISFPSAFKVEHSMLVYGDGPRWSYSDMRGFGSTIIPWLWFRLYWIAWASLLAVIARLLWIRGRESNVRYRSRVAIQRFTRSTALAGAISAGFVLLVGSVVFYHTNVLNEYLTSDEMNERKAQYELRYGKYRNARQPQMIDTKFNVDIYPQRKEVHVEARYTLINSDTAAIDSVHLGTVSPIKVNNVKFSKAAENVVTDDQRGHWIYKLREALLPGDSLELTFTAQYKEQGFHHKIANVAISEDATYLNNYDLLPVIGYRRSKEISDPVSRKEYNLPARPTIPSLYDNGARKKPLSTDRNGFEAIVSTEKGQTAIAPGTLQRTWTEEGRAFFHYKTDGPIRGEFAFISAKYAIKQHKWNDVDINIYYHPTHDFNIDRIVRSVKASLKYYTEKFGAYPYKTITVAERPGGGGGAHAEASFIDYGEQYSLMKPNDSPNGFDLPFYILAHEVAHQWFGSTQLTPAGVEGAGVLIEGLAVYAGMQVLHENYNDGHLQQYVNFLHSFYEMPRSMATNSLLQANETFLYYRKGGLAMHVMSKYVGQDKVNSALRSLLDRHKTGELPLPTTLDLYDEIKKVTPDSLNYLLNDFFAKNTYWRLKTKKFSTSKTNEGNWAVELDVHAEKFLVDSTGAEHNTPMNDWIEVGIYEDFEGVKEPIYLKKHRIRTGDQTIKVMVPKKPTSAGIDPNHLMIDVRRDDNVMVLED